MSDALLNTEFPDLKLVARGKVRDIYDLGDTLLMVATDRISAFDVIMPNPIPDKGKILNLISLFWFRHMESLVKNHIISSDVDDFPESCAPYKDILRDRSMHVKKAEPLLVECVARGYISGSGWAAYQESKEICGIKLADGLKESEKLPEPIFTPATKAEAGDHDINIDFEETVKILGDDIANKARELTMAIYNKGAEIAKEKGIIIADTKFEFGMFDGELILIDEVLTPDSSRFWPEKLYEPGRGQESFDKQYLRDYLLSINWPKKPPAPELPEEVQMNTRRKYLEALELVTGSTYGL